MALKNLQLILLSTLIFSSAFVQQITPSSGQVSKATREVAVTVKVVLVGFAEEWVDRDYFSWHYQTPDHRLNNIWNWGDFQQTGVTYKISYDLNFAPQALEDGLVDFLKSIGEKRSGVNRWFYYWEYSEADKMWVKGFHKTDYVVYDAAEVEEWLYQQSSDYGRFPENGWTLIVTYLPELPSFTAAQYKKYWDDNSKVPSGVLPHYYGMSFVDSDLGYKLRYRDFMTGYGGRHRMWFVDLSAGPTWWSQYDDLPLNTIIEDQGIQLDTAFGKQWLTQYLADYTWEMVYNIVVPEFVYDPIYTSKYRLVVKVLDDRTSDEKKAIPIQSTINRDAITRAFEDLAPYVKVQVDLQFEDTAIHPELQKLLKENRRFYGSYIVRDLLLDKYEYVDERPIYKYLQQNLHSFVPQILRDETELTIPMFVFALSGDAHFGASYKWEVGNDPERTYGGVALGDLVMIGHSHLDFHYGDEVGQKGKGFGMTQTVIHEAGHMVGLSHPHTYGSIGDFCLTAMSYFTYDYVFGQNDKDALQRIHVDKLILQTLTVEEQAREHFMGKVASPDLEAKLSQAGDKIRESETLYDQMSYPESLNVALEARGIARSTLEEIDRLPQSTAPLEEKIAQLESQLPLYLAMGLGVGFGVAVVVFLVMRRQVRRGEESGKTRPYAEALRRCSSCGNEIMPQSVYCEHCGAKQT